MPHPQLVVFVAYVLTTTQVASTRATHVPRSTRVVHDLMCFFMRRVVVVANANCMFGGRCWAHAARACAFRELGHGPYTHANMRTRSRQGCVFFPKPNRKRNASTKNVYTWRNTRGRHELGGFECGSLSSLSKEFKQCEEKLTIYRFMRSFI